MSTPKEGDSDVVALIDENRDLFRRIAESNLPIAEEAQRALEILESTQEGGHD